MDEEVTAVCIDNGSGQIKAGFAGAEAPNFCFSSLVGRSSYDEILCGQTKDQLLQQGVTNVRSPIRDGVIHDWEAMESVWAYAFKKCLSI